MTENPVKRTPPIHSRLHEEMLDSFDEELELEIDDDRLDALTGEFSGHSATETVDRRVYFKELFRRAGRTGQTAKLGSAPEAQGGGDFRGRDSAGKGGVIKRYHPAPQSAGLSRRRAAGAERA